MNSRDREIRVLGVESGRLAKEDAEGYIDFLRAGVLDNHDHNLLVLPEKWVAENISGDEYDHIVSRFSDISSAYGSTIVPGSFAVETDPGKWKNISPVIDRGHVLGTQAKVSLFMHERNSLSPGTRIETFSALSTTLAVEICYDIDFPYFTKVAVRRGASVVVNPSLIHRDFHDMWHLYVTSRSLENRVPVISINSSSPDFAGDSIAVVPYLHEWGVKLRTYRSSGGILEATINVGEVSELARKREAEDPGVYSLNGEK